jgi:hypothetical protein
VSVQNEVDPLEGVQIAARNLLSDKLWHTVSDESGSFAIDSLPPGKYEVWTCLDGFDEIRFRFDLDSDSPTSHLDLYLGPSEASGRRDVVSADTTEPAQSSNNSKS